MSKRSAAHVDVAKRLLAREGEGGGGGSAQERAAAAVRVYGRLADRLAPVIGAAGFQAIFARSVKLSTDDFPPLADVLVAAGAPDHISSLSSPAEHALRLLACLSKLPLAAASDAAAALFGTLLGLLTAFLGERLVWQVLRSEFPAIDDLVPKETE